MNENQTVCLSTAYLAPVHYYARMLVAKQVIVEQHENYIKQTYRNRCTIVGGNGMVGLSIPVDKGVAPKCPIRDVRISDHYDWQTLHWRTIEAAYNSSPFFDYYRDDFAPFFEKRWTFLFDFNVEIQQVVLQLLDEKPDIVLSNTYVANYDASVLDFRQTISPKIEPEKIDPFYREMSYYQVFNDRFGFVPNLSIIDLLFNMGPETSLVLRQMSKDS